MNKQPPVDMKNIILSVILSMLIVFGWQYYYTGPAAEKAKQEAALVQKKTEEAKLPDAPAAMSVKPRADVIAATTRIVIETEKLSGSVNLTGAQLDDLHLNTYFETAAKGSPSITLLSPSGTANAYYVEQGFSALSGATVKLPDSKTVWTAPVGAKLTNETPLVLTWDNGEGVTFTKTISISDDYLFTVKQDVANKSAAAFSLFPYARVQRQDTPKVEGIWVFFEGMLGVHSNGLNEHTYDDIKESKEPVNVDAVGGWAGFTDKYWATVLVPDTKTKVTNSYKYIPQGPRDAYQADYVGTEAINVAAGTMASYQDHIYAGAKIVSKIDQIAKQNGFDRFDLMIDWGWFAPITKAMFYLLDFVQGLVSNFGVAILLVTVLVKAVLFPLANKSYASMSKMKNLKPQMDAIKAKFPDDKTKQQQETMELYKREKVSPLAGCLPMVIQIPIFFSLYKVIYTTIELRHAPFFGWIQDLSAADPTSIFNLFGLIPWQPWPSLMIGVWPILMGITMWIQMRLNPTPPDPVQAAMFNWMPVMFTFMLGTFPAGLVIYWAWSNTLSVFQQAYIMKKHGTEIDIFGNMKDSIPFLKKKPAAP